MRLRLKRRGGNAVEGETGESWLIRGKSRDRYSSIRLMSRCKKDVLRDVCVVRAIRRQGTALVLLPLKRAAHLVPPWTHQQNPTGLGTQSPGRVISAWAKVLALAIRQMKHARAILTCPNLHITVVKTASSQVLFGLGLSEKYS